MPGVRMYRVTMTQADGSKGRYTAPFESGAEAAVQTLADFPDTRRLSVIYVGTWSQVQRKERCDA
jgi:hypothetical protein